MPVEQRRHPVRVVGVGEQHLVGDPVQHARGRGAVEMAGVAAGHVVVPAVEVAAEPQQLGPPGRRPRQAERHQRRLRARRGEPHPLGRRHHAAHEVGPAHLELMAGAVMGAAVELGVHGLQHRRVVVPQQQRAMAAEIVDVLIAVDVPFQRALGPRHIERVRIQLACVMGDPARQQVARPRRQLGRAWGRRAVALGQADIGQFRERHDQAFSGMMVVVSARSASTPARVSATV